MRLTDFSIAIVSACFLLLSNCGSDDTPLPGAPDHVSAEALKNHVAILASDELEGRATGTKGYDEAAVYVAQQFRSIGLQPAGAKGSYFQPIVLKKMRVINQSAQVILRGKGKPRLLQYTEDFYYTINPRIPRLEHTAPLVYAGYGVRAPAYGLNSYEGLDVTDKIAVVLAGVPEGLPPEEGAALSSTRRKAADALRAGAVGIAVIYTQKWEKGEPFASRAARAATADLVWLDRDGVPSSTLGDLKLLIRFSPEAGALLFEDAPSSYAQVREAAAAGTPLKGFALPQSLTAGYLLEESSLASANVIARLPANAPSPAADGTGDTTQGVLLTAHLDHLGRGKAVNGDEIYNGAVDNALGVAAIIEAARALAAQPEQRSRDVYFTALTGEEDGLLGARYLARHLPAPPAQIAAVLNIDMPVAFYPLASIQASGETHSNLGTLAGRAAQRYGLTLEDDPMPEEAIFIRSDHYAFVERGIPSLYLNIGVATPAGVAMEGLEQLNSFLTSHYHAPSDEITLPIDWTAAARFADVHVEMLRDLASRPIAISWSADSFFNKPRGSN